MKKIRKHGAHDVSAADYHADPAWSPSLSASIATILTEASPHHAWFAHPRLNPDFVAEHKTQFDIGSAAHAVLLEDGDGVTLIDRVDYRSEAAKRERDAARAAGKIPILRHERKAVWSMVGRGHDAIKAHHLGKRFFAGNAETEKTIIFRERKVLCRCRPDRYAADGSIAFDYKTTGQTGEPRQWSAHNLWPRGAIQAALYRRAIEFMTGRRPRFVFIIQETAPPFAVSFVELSPGALAIADRTVDRSLDTWARCLNTDEWPAYDPAVFMAEAPAWIETREIERELDDEDKSNALLARHANAQAPL